MSACTFEEIVIPDMIGRYARDVLYQRRASKAGLIVFETMKTIIVRTDDNTCKTYAKDCLSMHLESVQVLGANLANIYTRRRLTRYD